MKATRACWIALVIMMLGCSEPEVVQDPPIEAYEISTLAPDGVTIHGYVSKVGLEDTAPLIMLFHQAGGDARGEYGELIPWLNGNGFRTVAWDLRAGGDRFGGVNQTVAHLAEGTPTGYCESYPDLQAALDHVIEQELASEVIVWGSSYSASLVFRLAAENQDHISGLLAFSPAAGGPMIDCRPRMWVENVAVPMHAFRPAGEMGSDSSIEQREVLMASGVEFKVIEHGVHGSSMLVDSRTEQDMSAERDEVIRWLKGVAQSSGSGS